MSEDKRLEAVRSALKAYPDFPKPGILFQDIFGVFSNPTALEEKFYRRLFYASFYEVLSNVFIKRGFQLTPGYR